MPHKTCSTAHAHQLDKIQTLLNIILSWHARRYVEAGQDWEERAQAVLPVGRDGRDVGAGRGSAIQLQVGGRSGFPRQGRLPELLDAASSMHMAHVHAARSQQMCLAWALEGLNLSGCEQCMLLLHPSLVMLSSTEQRRTVWDPHKS